LSGSTFFSLPFLDTQLLRVKLLVITNYPRHTRNELPKTNRKTYFINTMNVGEFLVSDKLHALKMAFKCSKMKGRAWIVISGVYVDRSWSKKFCCGALVSISCACMKRCWT